MILAKPPLRRRAIAAPLAPTRPAGDVIASVAPGTYPVSLRVEYANGSPTPQPAPPQPVAPVFAAPQYSAPPVAPAPAVGPDESADDADEDPSEVE